MPGSTAREQRNVPLRLTSTSPHQVDGSASATEPTARQAPALLTSSVGGPRLDSVAATSLSTVAPFVTSVDTAMARHPIPMIASADRAATAIAAPACASASAMARPTPRPLPVTMATCPSRRASAVIGSSLSVCVFRGYTSPATGSGRENVLEQRLTQKTATTPSCRLCGTPLRRTFVDLGKSPLCESFLTAEQLDEVEHFYPLHVRICDECLLAQLETHVPASEIFRDYAYFSSYSDSWVEHARAYAEMAVARFGLTSETLVI